MGFGLGVRGAVGSPRAARGALRRCRAEVEGGQSVSDPFPIVEFNQAQLNLLSAQIAYANTQYEYLLQRSALNFQTGTLR